MLSNNQLKLSDSDSQSSVLHSDNVSTYIYVSDFVDNLNGLWSNGFHLFKAFFPNGESLAVMNKTNTPLEFSLDYKTNITAKFTLLKNAEGLIIDVMKPKSPFAVNKKLKYFLQISREFEVVSVEDNLIVIKYGEPDRSGFGYDEFYCGVSVSNAEVFTNVKQTEDGITFGVKTLTKTVANRDKTEILICYHNALEPLRKKIASRLINIDKLKKIHIKNTFLPFKFVNFNIENSFWNKALTWATISASNFVMQKTGHIGIWAGFHWFDNNWGRDTFIALPGISLVSGRYEEASHIIRTFLRHINKDEQSPNYGKIPNVIVSDDKIIYNTSDATPLLIRQIYEYYLYSGDTNLIGSVLEELIFVIDNVYISHKDKDNFLYQPDSDDWMDAKLDGKYPLSPRGNRSVEIQSLWYVALNVASILINEFTSKINSFDEDSRCSLREKAVGYLNEAKILKKSINKYFISGEAPYIYDHINEDDSPDKQIRPNGLLAVHYTMLPNIEPLFPDDTVVKYLKYIHSKLIYRHGVCSLDSKDPAFHCRHIDEHYHKDCAYHNGCNWLWLSGAYTTVACRYGLSNVSAEHNESLTEQLLSQGCLGTLSELNDPLLDKGKVKLSGTYSQAWSVAEYNRSFFQDYLGIRPDVPSRKLYVSPNVPNILGCIKATIRYGLNESVNIYARVNRKSSKLSYLEISGANVLYPLDVVCRIPVSDKNNSHEYMELTLTLNNKDDKVKINFANTYSKNIKIQEITTFGSLVIKSLSSFTKHYPKINESDFAFAPNLTQKETAALPTQQTKDLYEKIARKNKPTTITS